MDPSRQWLNYDDVKMVTKYLGYIYYLKSNFNLSWVSKMSPLPKSDFNSINQKPVSNNLYWLVTQVLGDRQGRVVQSKVKVLEIR